MDAQRQAELIHAALKQLYELGGEAFPCELFAELERKLNLEPSEKEPYSTASIPRWRSIINFNSIDCIKAGYLL